MMRSKLFVPGTRADRFAKALAAGADAVSFDLEDAVLEARRDEARAAVAAFLRTQPSAEAGDGAGRPLLIVRVNPVGTPHFEADVDAVVGPALALVNLPKVDDPGQVVAAAAAVERAERRHGGRVRLLVNVETPKALRRAAELAAAHPRVAGLQLGLADLTEPLGIDRGDAAAVAALMLALRLAAGEAGVWALDAAHPGVADSAGFEAEARQARRLGFAGKSCIHPRQVALANAVFAPTAAEVAAAEQLLAAVAAAAARGDGACSVDGRMVDRAFVARAERTLALARVVR